MRKRTANKRHRLTDRIYNDILVGRFINNVMKEGLKQKAERIVYDAFGIIQEKLNTEPVEVFKKAIHNASLRLKYAPGESAVQITRCQPK